MIRNYEAFTYKSSLPRMIEPSRALPQTMSDTAFAEKRMVRHWAVILIGKI